MWSERHLPKVILGKIFWWVSNWLNLPSWKIWTCLNVEENSPSKANNRRALQGRQPKPPVRCPTDPTRRTITSYLGRVSKCLSALERTICWCLRSLGFVIIDQQMFKTFNTFYSVEPRLWSMYLRTWGLIPGQRRTCGPAGAGRRCSSAPPRPPLLLLALRCRCCCWRSWCLTRCCWTSCYKPEPGAFTPDTGRAFVCTCALIPPLLLRGAVWRAGWRGLGGRGQSFLSRLQTLDLQLLRRRFREQV